MRLIEEPQELEHLLLRTDLSLFWFKKGDEFVGPYVDVPFRRHDFVPVVEATKKQLKKGLKS